MKLSVLLVAILAGSASLASASPVCTTLSTMNQFVALGAGGCTYNDLLFSNFLYAGTKAGTGVAVPAVNVTLSFVGGGTSNEGIIFASTGWFVNTSSPTLASYVDSSIQFAVSTLSHAALIDDADMLLLSASTTGAGKATIGETVNPGGYSLTVKASGPLASEVYFPKTSTVSVIKDLRVSLPAASSGSAQINSFEEDFSVAPEPAGMALIGSGLVLLGLWRRRAARG